MKQKIKLIVIFKMEKFPLNFYKYYYNVSMKKNNFKYYKILILLLHKIIIIMQAYLKELMNY